MSDTVDAQNRVAELEHRLAAEVATRRRLVEVAATLNTTFKLEDLLQVIMSSAAELLDAETSSLLLLDEETNELTIEVATGDTAGSVVQQRIPPGVGIAGWVMEHGEPVVIDDPAADERFYSDVGQAIGFETRNLLAVPLRVKDRAIGVVEVLNKRGGDGFTARDVEVAGGLASLAAIALDNAALYARLADAVVAARMSYRL